MRMKWNRLIAVIMIVMNLLYMFPLVIYADESNTPVFELSVRVSDSVDEMSTISAIEQDGVLLVDFEQICQVLDVAAEGEYCLSDSPIAKDFEYSVHNFDMIGNQRRRSNYEDAFGVDLEKCDASEGFSLQKYRNSYRTFYFRIGSDVVLSLDNGSTPFLWSNNLNYSVNLGTKVVKVDNHIMVPMVMLLSILDSYALVDSGTIIIGALEQTAMDILSLNYLEDYSFDVIRDGYMTLKSYSDVTEYIEKYRKIKAQFQGMITLDYQKIIESIPRDQSRVARALSQELCTVTPEQAMNIEEYVLEQQLTTDMTKAFSDAWTSTIIKGDKSINYGINYGAEQAYNDIVDKWKSAEIDFDNATFSSTKARIANYQKFQKAMVDDLADSRKKGFDIKTSSSVLDITAKSLCVALTATFSYFTASKRIVSTQQKNVDAVKTYLEKYNKEYEKKGSVGDNRPAILDYNYDVNNDRNLTEFARLGFILQCSKRLMDEIGEDIKLYDGKNINVFENEELRNSIFSDVNNSIVSMSSGPLLDKMIPGNVYGGWVTAVASLAMDGVEIIGNHLSNGAFDSMDALYESIYTMALEDDARLLSYYGDYDDLETFKQLTWMRLKAFYLTRMNFAIFVYGRDMEKFRKEMPVMATECDQLIRMMSVLQHGIDGVTKESLEEASKNAKQCNDSLIDEINNSEKEESKEKWLCISEEESVASTGEVTETIDYKYDENGLMIESIRHKMSADDITRYFYDQNDNCILQSDYSLHKGNQKYFLQDRKYIYNDNNKLAKEYILGSSSYDMDTYNEYKYEGGLLKEVDGYSFNKLKSKAVYVYEDGILVAIESTHSNNWDYLSRHSFTYDSEGKLIKENFENESRAGGEITYEYNDFGGIIRQTEIYPTDTQMEYSRDKYYLFEYDENNNMIRKIACDDQWNPLRIITYNYCVMDEYVSEGMNEFNGVFRLEYNLVLPNGFYNGVRLKNGGDVDKIYCECDVSGIYNELVNLYIEVNGKQLRDSLEFIDSSDLRALYATDLDMSDQYGNIIACLVGEDDTNETVIYAYDENGIIKIAELDGLVDLYSINGEGEIATNISLIGGIRTIGKFVVHRCVSVNGRDVTEGNTSIGHFEVEDDEEKYCDGFTFYTNADLNVYQDAGSDVISDIIPAGTEVAIINHKIIDVVYYGYNVTDDAFYVTGGGISGWVTNYDLRQAATDYYAVG